MYLQTSSLRFNKEIIFTFIILWDQDKTERMCLHLLYVLSDQLDRWSRISLVEKGLIHFQKVPWAGWCGAQECSRM
jgi:hypothetical protein